MAKFVPIVNCGILAGETPMHWDVCECKPFDTEEECEQWIEDNKNEFSGDEMAGGIYPQEISDTED